MGGKNVRKVMARKQLPKIIQLIPISPFMISGSTFFLSRYQFKRPPNKRSNVNDILKEVIRSLMECRKPAPKSNL